MKKLSWISLILGLVLLSIGGYQYFNTQHQVHQSLSTVKKKLTDQVRTKAQEKKKTILSFNPQMNKPIGVLKVPGLERKLPIIEGTNDQALGKGVGHYVKTGFPSQDRPILLSGHRDTVFRRFGELKKGDTFIVKLPYGEYRYKMVNSIIVDADNQSIVQEALAGNKEKLLISTCYPFNYIGDAPKRYIIYANPEKTSQK